ncbi:hypothetical protein FOA52_009297 [Chlamydomonas sp. UWO 241]|nr:hypothetical protein FOA52_009297 [Chlamydomonas sp. UWO 241]
MDKLKTFSGLFQSKKLTNGTEVVLLNNVAGVLEVLVAPTAATSYSGAKPELTIPSIALCRGLFEIFLGSEPVIASGPAVWAAGAKQMLQEDEARRNVDTLKT